MKPAVDRLEDKLEGTWVIVRLDVQSDLGAVLKEEYKATLVPTFLVFDAKGEELMRVNRVPTYQELMGIND
tara:strand:+ start:447 stop:659 length:213 start_codon:yes stop_codon:yes gene_type:complete